ncbi:hypothetical protein [Streptomyces sp. NPDC020681]
MTVQVCTTAIRECACIRSEMRLYSDALHKPHLTAADLCRRHLAAASEKE